jgi:hypothetical protein
MMTAIHLFDLNDTLCEYWQKELDADTKEFLINFSQKHPISIISGGSVDSIINKIGEVKNHCGMILGYSGLEVLTATGEYHPPPPIEFPESLIQYILDWHDGLTVEETPVSLYIPKVKGETRKKLVKDLNNDFPEFTTTYDNRDYGITVQMFNKSIAIPYFKQRIVFYTDAFERYTFDNIACKAFRKAGHAIVPVNEPCDFIRKIQS